MIEILDMAKTRFWLLLDQESLMDMPFLKGHFLWLETNPTETKVFKRIT